ncbi:Flavodoxin [Arthrobacter sp. yr096]|uniref:flavodoxin n=1 Tax=Arthrobacter sp. yr096 TaxID=1761750 RepID=UPI0008D1F600|nr:flavodoxin [Arthrobacter sp. yr096]SEJ63005.1 Flavodoxin [Arthrobacter sp. yr096]
MHRVISPIPALDRRTLLRTAFAGAASGVLATGAAGCQPSQQGTSPQGTTGKRVLLAFFSRAGENYYYGDRINLDVGNTEVLAGMIRSRISCDVYRIEATDPYPFDYGETVARNSQEQDSDARPAIANALPSIDQYDTVLLASGIWGSRAPMIMATFTEGLDFTGKTVHPMVTYAVSGLGSTERDYAESCRGATVGQGLAVRGEEVNQGGAAVESWLRDNQLPAT